jgi:hypothetical protein
MLVTTLVILTVGVLITLTATVLIPRVRLRSGVSAPNLGWMSEQWLAEHRASHPS